MDFPDALRMAIDGLRIQRTASMDLGQHVVVMSWNLRSIDAELVLRTALPDGTVRTEPWTPSSADMLAGDWELAR